MSGTAVNLEPFGAPLKIHPSIKLARYALLGLGILYGIRRHRYLARKDAEKKEYLAKMQPIWDKEKAEKTAAQMKIQLEDLKKQGVDLG